MSSIPKNHSLLPSVFDRLLQQDDSRLRNASLDPTEVVEELKRNVRRDLEDLLNTRIRCIPLPPEPEGEERVLDRPELLKYSLVNYGIPDFTGIGFGSQEKHEQLRQIICEAIETFEPRLKSVVVQLESTAEPLDRTLHFRIGALLLAEPSPVPVMFDSVLKTLTGEFELTGEVADDR